MYLDKIDDKIVIVNEEGNIIAEVMGLQEFFVDVEQLGCSVAKFSGIEVKNELTAKIKTELDAYEELISEEIVNFNKEFNQLQLEYLNLE